MNSHIIIVKKVKTMCMEQNFYIGTLCSSSFFYDFIYDFVTTLRLGKE